MRVLLPEGLAWPHHTGWLLALVDGLRMLSGTLSNYGISIPLDPEAKR